MPLNRVIYLPIQIKKRAFVAKLLLAYLSLQYGYKVVIGKRHSVKKIALNNCDGIFLEKDFFGKKSEYFEMFKNRDMIFYGLDDEGLVFHDDEEYIDRRVDLESIKHMKRVFAWGKRHEKILKEFIGENSSDKVILAGNPRVDLLGDIIKYVYHKEIYNIKKSCGNFVIFNSFFALANGIRPIESQLRRLKKMKKNISQEMLDYWYGFYKHQKNLFDEIKDELLGLAEDNSLNIVIRPHPNEKAKTWQKIFKDHENVTITKDYDIFPWIYCADVVMHNSSSTGVESYLLGKNVIALKPVSDDNFDLDLPNSLSVVIKDGKTLKKTIYEMLNNTFYEDESVKEKKREIMNYHIYFSDKLACENILDEFNKNEFSQNMLQVKKDYLNLFAGVFLKVLAFIDRKISLNLKNPSIINDFPPTSKREVIRYLKNMDEYFGYNFKFKVTTVASSCFLVEKV